MTRFAKLPVLMVLMAAGYLVSRDAPAAEVLTQVRVVCAADPAGKRTECPADTSAGVVLAKSMGSAPCLLGKTWGYENDKVWVSEGCGAEFVTGKVATAAAAAAAAAAGAAAGSAAEVAKPSSPEYIPNAGFRLYEGDNARSTCACSPMCATSTRRDWIPATPISSVTLMT